MAVGFKVHANIKIFFGSFVDVLYARFGAHGFHAVLLAKFRERAVTIRRVRDAQRYLVRQSSQEDLFDEEEGE